MTRLRSPVQTALGVSALGLALALAAGGAAVAQDATRLTVYTALENDQLETLKGAFEAANPDIAIDWVRDSTGVITARVLAEKDNPQADVVWGLALSSLNRFQADGLLEAYSPQGADQLKPQFRSSADPMAWTGMDAFLSVICINTAEQGEAPMPASWEDLTNPAFAGRLVMPNPASSGTGYLTVWSWVQTMGEEAAWSFMDRLHQNIAVYTHSGSAPCVQVARGEQMAGIGVDMRAAREKSQGAPIEIILPKEGAGWDMEATAIFKGTDALDAAKRLADWSVTPAAQQIYGESYAILGLPGIDAMPENYPENAEAAMVAVDFDAMAANRDRILAEWTSRYESKSEPK